MSFINCDKCHTPFQEKDWGNAKKMPVKLSNCGHIVHYSCKTIEGKVQKCSSCAQTIIGEYQPSENELRIGGEKKFENRKFTTEDSSSDDESSSSSSESPESSEAPESSESESESSESSSDSEDDSVKRSRKVLEAVERLQNIAWNDTARSTKPKPYEEPVSNDSLTSDDPCDNLPNEITPDGRNVYRNKYLTIKPPARSIIIGCTVRPGPTIMYNFGL